MEQSSAPEFLSHSISMFAIGSSCHRGSDAQQLRHHFGIIHAELLKRRTLAAVKIGAW